jgi:hypothetical protein
MKTHYKIHLKKKRRRMGLKLRSTNKNDLLSGNQRSLPRLKTKKDFKNEISTTEVSIHNFSKTNSLESKSAVIEKQPAQAGQPIIVLMKIEKEDNFTSRILSHENKIMERKEKREGQTNSKKATKFSSIKRSNSITSQTPGSNKNKQKDKENESIQGQQELSPLEKSGGQTSVNLVVIESPASNGDKTNNNTPMMNQIAHLTTSSTFNNKPITNTAVENFGIGNISKISHLINNDLSINKSKQNYNNINIHQPTQSSNMHSIQHMPTLPGIIGNISQFTHLVNNSDQGNISSNSGCFNNPLFTPRSSCMTPVSSLRHQLQKTNESEFGTLSNKEAENIYNNLKNSMDNVNKKDKSAMYLEFLQKYADLIEAKTEIHIQNLTNLINLYEKKIHPDSRNLTPRNEVVNNKLQVNSMMVNNMNNNYTFTNLSQNYNTMNAILEPVSPSIRRNIMQMGMDHGSAFSPCAIINQHIYLENSPRTHHVWSPMSTRSPNNFNQPHLISMNAGRPPYLPLNSAKTDIVKNYSYNCKSNF